MGLLHGPKCQANPQVPQGVAGPGVVQINDRHVLRSAREAWRILGTELRITANNKDDAALSPHQVEASLSHRDPRRHPVREFDPVVLDAITE